MRIDEQTTIGDIIKKGAEVDLLKLATDLVARKTEQLESHESELEGCLRTIRKINKAITHNEAIEALCDPENK